MAHVKPHEINVFLVNFNLKMSFLMFAGGYSDHDPHGGGGGGYDDHHSGYGKEAPKADEGYGGGERGCAESM